MARRIVIEEPCEHGLFWTHWPDGPDCPGGSRRVLDPGSYVLIEKVDGEWPEWANGAVGLAFEGDDDQINEFADRILDALAGGEQP